jgi:hypothetical protein
MISERTDDPSLRDLSGYELNETLLIRLGPLCWRRWAWGAKKHPKRYKTSRVWNAPAAAADHRRAVALLGKRGDVREESPQEDGHSQ